MSNLSLRPIDIVCLLLVTAISIIGINHYVYGLYNHCITIPFIKNLIDPQLYRHDYLLAEKQYFYTLFLPFSASFIKFLNLSIPISFFILYVISIAASFMFFFLIALRLFGSREVAYLSVMLVVFSFTTLGQEKTIENLLMERTFVLPFLLGAFYFLLKEKYILCGLLASIAFLFHPLSASYVLLMICVCSAYRSFQEKRFTKLAVTFAIISVVISPLVILKMLNPAPGLHFFSVDPEWVELLRLRASHHLFPTEWSRLSIIQAAAFIFAFILCWKYKPVKELHRMVLIIFSLTIGMMIIGTIFTEWIPVSVIIQFQLFRSFKFMAFFAVIYFANYLLKESNSPTGIAWKVIITTLFISPYFHESGSVVAGIILLILTALIGSGILEKFGKEQAKYLVPGMLLILLSFGTINNIRRSFFKIGNAQEKNWLEAQHWAKQNTPADAAFIVPPYLEGFRVESERTLYGEWKDGTQMFFHPDFGHEWMRRMKNLGYIPGKKFSETYLALSESDLNKCATELQKFHTSIYLVLPVEKKQINQLPLYANEKYKVYKVSESLAKIAHVNFVENGAHKFVAKTSQVRN